MNQPNADHMTDAEWRAALRKHRAAQLQFMVEELDEFPDRYRERVRSAMASAWYLGWHDGYEDRDRIGRLPADPHDDPQDATPNPFAKFEVI